MVSCLIIAQQKSMTNPSATSDISSPFTMAELIAAIETSRQRTTPGPDGIPYAVFKNMEGAAIDALLEAINTVWETGIVPPDWKHSVVVPIPKPGKPPNNLQSLRPISLTPTICKLAEKMLATRVSWWLERKKKYHPAQIGFRSYLGRRTFHIVGRCVAGFTTQSRRAYSNSHRYNESLR